MNSTIIAVVLWLLTGLGCDVKFSPAYQRIETERSARQEHDSAENSMWRTPAALYGP